MWTLPNPPPAEFPSSTEGEQKFAQITVHLPPTNGPDSAAI
jgi:hypothetical protein